MKKGMPRICDTYLKPLPRPFSKRRKRRVTRTQDRGTRVRYGKTRQQRSKRRLAWQATLASDRRVTWRK